MWNKSSSNVESLTQQLSLVEKWIKDKINSVVYVNPLSQIINYNVGFLLKLMLWHLDSFHSSILVIIFHQKMYIHDHLTFVWLSLPFPLYVWRNASEIY